MAFLTVETTICTTNVIAKPFSIHYWSREAGVMKLSGSQIRATPHQRTSDERVRGTSDGEPSGGNRSIGW